MKEIASNLDYINLEIEEIRSLLQGLGFAIFESGENTNCFERGYYNIINQLKNIENKLDDKVSKLLKYKNEKANIILTNIQNARTQETEN